MVWSVMAAADEDGRIKLDAFLRDVEVEHISFLQRLCATRYLTVSRDRSMELNVDPRAPVIYFQQRFGPLARP